MMMMMMMKKKREKEKKENSFLNTSDKYYSCPSQAMYNNSPMLLYLTPSKQ
jgi:hypothetical protein